MRNLSIIIPTCNRADLLDKCITTIARTVACDYEIIVVDGASTDRTATLLEKATDHFGDRLIWIRERQTPGIRPSCQPRFPRRNGSISHLAQ